MEPVTIWLVSTIAELVVSDAYSALRQLLIARYTKATSLHIAMDALEAHPSGEAQRAALGTELEAVHAQGDEVLLDAIRALLESARDASSGRAIGVDLEDSKADLVLLDGARVHRDGTALRATRCDFKEVRIAKVEVGGAATGK